MKNIHIAVIGGPATGKSTYISALVQGLKDKLWNETDLAYLPAAPNLWSLYRKGELYFFNDYHIFCMGDMAFLIFLY